MADIRQLYDNKKPS